MDQPNDEVHITTQNARAGVTGHGVRYVLIVSLALVIIAFAALWLFGTRDAERPGTASTAAAASEVPAPAAT